MRPTLAWAAAAAGCACCLLGGGGFITATAEATIVAPAAVVVVSRHGVRTPYSPTGGDLTADTFVPYSHKHAQFPVTAREWGAESITGQPLTEHGKRAIKRMGNYFRVA